MKLSNNILMKLFSIKIKQSFKNKFRIYYLSFKQLELIKIKAFLFFLFKITKILRYPITY